MNLSSFRARLGRALRSVRLSRRSTLLALCLLVGARTVHAVELDTEISIEIPANTPLNQAVTLWGAATGIQVMLSDQAAAGHNVEAIHGKLSARAALVQMLQNSGLQYRVEQESVVITPIGPAPVPVKPANGETQSDLSGQKADVTRAADFNGPKLEEVVVTGTHIIGADPDSMVIVVDQKSIQHSGYQSMGELVQKQPQNFGGGSNANVIGAGGRTNIRSPSGAYTANLRGLGSESTLTLLDGFRLASAADSGAVDLNQIPTAAVKQVEIIPNGETAIYGADAVAGVVNIIPRDDYKGVEASVGLGRAT